MRLSIIPIIYFLTFFNSSLEDNNTIWDFTKRQTPQVFNDLALAAQAPDNENMNEAYEDYDRNMYERGGGRARQHSMSLAFKAAEEAKAATNAQAAAGQAASQQIKLQLAEKAFQAARAAEIALSDKQDMVERLEQEIQEADAVYQEESASLQDNQQSVQYAMLTAQQAKELQKTLSLAAQVAQSTVGNSEQAASGAQVGYMEKTQLVEAAKSRVEQLLHLLSSARIDFANIKQAAYNAACAAREAKANAERGRRQLDKRFSSANRSPPGQQKQYLNMPLSAAHKSPHVQQKRHVELPAPKEQQKRHVDTPLTSPHRLPYMEQKRHFDKSHFF